MLPSGRGEAPGAACPGAGGGSLDGAGLQLPPDTSDALALQNVASFFATVGHVASRGFAEFNDSAQDPLFAVTLSVPDGLAFS